MLNYIDLFSGAGGMSEGFRFNGYNPIAYVEMNESACFTIKTRNSYYWLKNNNKLDKYHLYLTGNITRDELYSYVPSNILEKVINIEMNDKNMNLIIDRIDKLKGDFGVYLVVGGPPCQSYSMAGKSRRSNTKSDARNYLYNHYVKILEKYKPKIFIFENVPGLSL